TPEANEADRVARRTWLCKQLRGHGEEVEFIELPPMLNISKARFDQFTSKFGDVFTAVALRCQVHTDKTLTQPRINMTQVLTVLEGDKKAVKKVRRDLHIELDDSITGEVALVSYFLQLVSVF
ncbi:hypothetical protein H4R21_002775, partial [Coemansia helicoidea]